MMNTRLFALFIAFLLLACGGGAGGGASSSSPVPVYDPGNTSADITVLMLGNSHTHSNGLPTTLANLIRAGRPGKTVNVTAAPGILFLDERLNDPQTLALFNRQQWSAVILQAQQYSQSGLFFYSTEEAVEWVKRTRTRNILPVMFPEWSRLSMDETDRIYQLHVSIAERQAACVAPIPQAFDLAAQRIPGIVLHDLDGNHSSPKGAFLAALMLYAALTGESPANLPAVTAYEVDAATQAQLRAVAAEQIRLVAPRKYCPNDASL